MKRSFILLRLVRAGAAALLSALAPVGTCLDLDGDGLSDLFEGAASTNLLADADPDFDGWNNKQEWLFGGNPLVWDDVAAFLAWEFAASNSSCTVRWHSEVAVRYQLNVNSNLTSWTPPVSWVIGTGSNLVSQQALSPESLQFLRLEAAVPLDSDGDELDDWEEAQFGSAPDDPDADRDTLTDSQEYLHKTRHDDADSDGDGWSDDAEVLVESDPTDPHATPVLFVAANPIQTVSSFANADPVHTVTRFASASPIQTVTTFASAPAVTVATLSPVVAPTVTVEAPAPESPEP